MKEKDCKYFKPISGVIGTCTCKVPWWTEQEKTFIEGDEINACPAFKRKIDSLWALNKGD
jgi:hypothetical protein